MERDLDNQALRNALCGASLKCENRRERAHLATTITRFAPLSRVSFLPSKPLWRGWGEEVPDRFMGSNSFAPMVVV
jgi:hypothetical protein